MIITLSEDTSADAEAGIRAYLDLAIIENPALNGVDISIERGDYTCVDGADELIGAQVLADVQRIITGVDAF